MLLNLKKHPLILSTLFFTSFVQRKNVMELQTKYNYRFTLLRKSFRSSC